MALQKKYGQEVEFIIADTGGSGSHLAQEFGVLYIPSYVFIDSSGKMIGDNPAGYQPEEKLSTLLASLLENGT